MRTVLASEFIDIVYHVTFNSLIVAMLKICCYETIANLISLDNDDDCMCACFSEYNTPFPRFV